MTPVETLKLLDLNPKSSPLLNKFYSRNFQQSMIRLRSQSRGTSLVSPQAQRTNLKPGEMEETR